MVNSWIRQRIEDLETAARAAAEERARAEGVVGDAPHHTLRRSALLGEEMDRVASELSGLRRKLANLERKGHGRLSVSATV